VRLAFDSRPRSDPRGIGRYARCLLAGLRDTAPREAEIEETHRPRRADVFHSPWIDGALLRSPCPMVVTVHDLTPLKRRSEYLRTGLSFRLRYLAVQRAMRVIVPTHAVAQDAISHLRLDPARVSVIGEAPAAVMYERHAEEVAAARRRYGLPEEYLLWVGGLQHPDPRKRVAALAGARRALPLVLVGPTRPWAHELPDVTLTGEVPDDDLAAIYSGARALVFPPRWWRRTCPRCAKCSTTARPSWSRATSKACSASLSRFVVPPPPPRPGAGRTPPEPPGRSTPTPVPTPED